jgi:hypothetical protein
MLKRFSLNKAFIKIQFSVFVAAFFYKKRVFFWKLFEQKMSSLFQSLGVTIELETITDSLTQLRSQNEGPVFQIIIGGTDSIK